MSEGQQTKLYLKPTISEAQNIGRCCNGKRGGLGPLIRKSTAGSRGSPKTVADLKVAPPLRR